MRLVVGFTLASAWSLCLWFLAVEMALPACERLQRDLLCGSF